MRSRFAAFAIGDVEYLWRTVHPDHEDGALAKEDVLRSLRVASRSLKYMRLTILDAKDARVLFVAGVFEKGRDRSFVELSTFATLGTAWRYLSGVTREARDVPNVAALTIASFDHHYSA